MDENGERTMQNIRIYTAQHELRCSGGNILGAYDLGTTRFGSDWALTCLEKLDRTLNCTSCLRKMFMGPLTVPVV